MSAAVKACTGKNYMCDGQIMWWWWWEIDIMVWVVVGMLVTIEVGDICGSSGSRGRDCGCMIVLWEYMIITSLISVRDIR